MKNCLDYILSNIMFITRIPVKINFNYKSDKGNVKFFPFVGLILGLVLFVVYLILRKFFSSLFLSTLICIIQVFLTGGIHLDGLSDMSDGIFSYRSKEKIVEIMKDSRIGAMGVLSLICIISLKIFMINEILINSLSFFLLLFPIIGRLGIVYMCHFGNPIDKSKLGVGFIGKINSLEFIFINIIYISIMVLFSFFLNDIGFKIIVISILLTTLSIFFIMKIIVDKISKIIDGISGDILGAGCEISELLSGILFILFYKIGELCLKLI